MLAALTSHPSTRQVRWRICLAQRYDGSGGKIVAEVPWFRYRGMVLLAA